MLILVRSCYATCLFSAGTRARLAPWSSDGLFLLHVGTHR